MTALLALLAMDALGASFQIRRPPPAQPGNSAEIHGLVSAEAGTPIAGAVVTVMHQESGERSGVVTGPDGLYLIASLAPGMYELTVEREPFGSASLPEVALEAGERLEINLQLKPSGSEILQRRLRRPGEDASPAGELESELPEAPVPSPAIRRPGEPAEPSQRPTDAVTARPPEFEPLGHAGAAHQTSNVPATEDFIPISDRWRIGLPPWDRYAPYGGDYPYVRGRTLDPYNQNVLKGDYPILGDDWFVVLSATSDTIAEYRRVPTVGPPSAARPNEPAFFSRGDQFQFFENIIFTAELFRGYTSFKPFDLQFRVTPAFSANFLQARETGLVNIDVRRGTTRWDYHPALQEAFAEIRLAETSPFFDFVSVRVGTQFFNSDFRGFIFFDNQPGLRLFGNLKANKHQYNLGYFYLLEKDTNSLLNKFEERRQEVFVANYYIQDFVKLGYTTEFSVHVNHDKPDFHMDNNGFLVRPAQVGNVVPKSVNAVYLGWSGDGHFRTLNINHAFYQVLGQEKPNQIAGDVFGPRDTDINAHMVALELSVDRDWKRYKGSFFYASGDDNISDGRARGFDTIVDNMNFAGGPLSLWNRQSVRLTGTAVGLMPRFSLLPSLRSAKEEGQANFVNPGLLLFNAGMDAELTPRLRTSINANLMWFSHTEVLEALLFQSEIGRFIGTDVSLGARWRPFLNNNIIVNLGVAGLIPGGGFKDVYSSKALLSTFLDLRLTY